MGAPGAKTGIFHDHPVAFRERSGGPRGDDFETSFVAGDGGGGLRAEERGEGGFGGVDALDLVYVCGVYGGGEGTEEEGCRGECGGYGVCVKSIGLISNCWFVKEGCGMGIGVAYESTSDGSPYFE
jgi:hypothetical protein